jgi:hypothetical protein
LWLFSIIGQYFFLQFEVDVMKKKNREQAEAENQDDMFAFSDLTTLGRECQAPSRKLMFFYL